MQVDAVPPAPQPAWAGEDYVLRLYVAGSTMRSTAAIRNLRQFCEKHLAGRCDLQVIDIYQHPELAANAQIIAAPTLVKLHPAPVRRAIGDLSNEARVMHALDLADLELPATVPG